MREKKKIFLIFLPYILAFIYSTMMYELALATTNNKYIYPDLLNNWIASLIINTIIILIITFLAQRSYIGRLVHFINTFSCIGIIIGKLFLTTKTTTNNNNIQIIGANIFTYFIICAVLGCLGFIMAKKLYGKDTKGEVISNISFFTIEIFLGLFIHIQMGWSLLVGYVNYYKKYPDGEINIYPYVIAFVLTVFIVIYLITKCQKYLSITISKNGTRILGQLNNETISEFDGSVGMPSETDLAIQRAKKHAERRCNHKGKYNQQELDKAMNKLMALPGLQQVKTQIQKQVANAQAIHQRGGNIPQSSMHMVFLGNPGTGKTTTARIIGKIYSSLGLLPTSNYVEVNKQDLIGQYTGQTITKTTLAFYNAMGGVMFIDEVYSLMDSGEFGKECIDALLKLMEDNRMNTMVIMAGYEKEMNDLFKLNQGFKSRIPEKNYIYFEDYNNLELVKIFKYQIYNYHFILSEDIKDEDIENITFNITRKKSYANARSCRDTVEQLIEIVNQRVVKNKLKGNAMNIILKEDILQLPEYKPNELERTSFDNLMQQLNSLIGLSTVKEKISEIINTKKFQVELKKRGIENNFDIQTTLHMLFIGNPGTGKTTVARLIGKIYNELGILSKNVFIEMSAKDLIIGKYAESMQEKIKQAEGGVLFIDEAYTLANENNDWKSSEIMSVLIPEMENHRLDTMFIFAGYTKEMNEFLQINSGMKSRIPQNNIIEFPDYNIDELTDIFYIEIKKRQLILSIDLKPLVKEYITNELSRLNNMNDFGNARGIRNLVDNIQRKMQNRIMKLSQFDLQKLTNDELKTILKEDFLS